MNRSASLHRMYLLGMLLFALATTSEAETIAGPIPGQSAPELLTAGPEISKAFAEFTKFR